MPGLAHLLKPTRRYGMTGRVQDQSGGNTCPRPDLASCLVLSGPAGSSPDGLVPQGEMHGRCRKGGVDLSRRWFMWNQYTKQEPMPARPFLKTTEAEPSFRDRRHSHASTSQPFLWLKQMHRNNPSKGRQDSWARQTMEKYITAKTGNEPPKGMNYTEFARYMIEQLGYVTEIIPKNNKEARWVVTAKAWETKKKLSRSQED